MLSILFLLFCNISKAQEKKLKTFEKNHYPNNHKNNPDERLKTFAPGMKILEIDSTVLAQYQMQNMGQLLNQKAPVFIQSYGINNIATLHFRGSSAAQSQVFWNGIPLNNASLGIADISLLGVGTFDKISIAFGGSSALLGSGNIGAAVMLSSDFNKHDSAHKWSNQLATEAGSFGQYKMMLRTQYNSTKQSLSVKLFGQKAANNFDFTLLDGKSSKMSNASLSSYAAIIDYSYRWNQSTAMQFSFWQQHFDREIPPALFESSSTKKQEDDAFRLFLGFEKSKKNGTKYYSKTGFTKDQMNYEDSAVHLFSRNATHQFYEEFGIKKNINNQHQVLLFVPVNFSWTKPQNDSQTRYQSKVAIAGSYLFVSKNEKLRAAINTRVEQINSKTFFLAGANISYSILPFLKVRANVQKSYRAPTLNEWYYQPGGNPNLKPERGWSEDAGYELKIPIGARIIFQHDLSIYNRNIHDWITWFGGAIWTPHNISEVQSRGLETANYLLWKNKNLSIKLGWNTSYVLATTVRSAIPNDGSIGKQIPYTPRYSGNTNFDINYKKIQMSYNHTFVGYRFTTTDESEYVPPYQLANLFVAFNSHIQKMNYKIYLQCNNCWNEPYQVVHLRPMPMRNFSAGLSIRF